MTTIIGLAEQQQARSGLAGWLPAASGCAGRRMVVVAAESVCWERACWLLADIPVSLARQQEGLVGPNSPIRNCRTARYPGAVGCPRVRELPECVEILAQALFVSGQATTVIAAELPSSRAMMHLDTVLTMIDRDTFVLYPYLDRHLRSWTMTRRDGGGLSISRNHSLWDALAVALAAENVTIVHRRGHQGRRA